ncbi:pyridoxamine kinase [Oceanispirochaeta crateris]|uniref:pyridoxal kinase n=1 Tax=Oceanispirochaeta crateris TaxID=2518645 RepID=A0A5C1QI26_9SPIO|nr:pyridoxamine kinase [Oceanispirochaeta crateris]QEN07793.1 pyridoxamine kinase [Oceanispirochaeta crateris]
MKNPIPRVAAVHDLSGYGRSSLTIVLPILSAMGINVCPLPTAVLSTQTDGFENYVFHDLTEVMEQTVNHWKTLPLSFDCIYSGFLGSPRQISILEDLIDHFQSEDQFITIDPVLGDDGSFYGPMGMEMIEGMKTLVQRAKLITPNYTEACFLLDRPFEQELTMKEAADLLRELASKGPEKVVITSIPLKNNKGINTVMAYEKDLHRIWKAETLHIPASYPGTGDIFASVITGRLLLGDSLPSAIDRAVHFVSHAIRNTFGHNTPQREGVLMEKSLYQLMTPENMSLCELMEMNELL